MAVFLGGGKNVRVLGWQKSSCKVWWQKTEGWSGKIFWGWSGKKYFEKTSNQSEILHSLKFLGLVSKQKSQMEEDK